MRNAPTRLLRGLGHGQGYRYAHDEPDAYAAGERYLPDELPDRRYYRPAPRGLEIRIGEALSRLRDKNTDEERFNVIDPKLLRADLPGVVRNLARRGFVLDETRITALEEQRKRAQIDADRVRAERNANAKAVGQAKGKGQDATALLARGEELTHELGQVDASLLTVQTELDALQLNLPNLLHESVPDGRDETANREVRRWGEPRKFDFKPLDHVALGEGLGGMDFEAAARMSGARFVVLRSQVAHLHRALAQFMLDLHTVEHGYTEIYAPYMVNAAALVGTGQLPKFEQDLFAVRGEQPCYLIPTAEVPVTNLVRDQIVTGRVTAIEIRVSHAEFPFRGRFGRQGHPRHDPQSSVRQGRTGADRDPRQVVCGAGGADWQCADSARTARNSVPDRGAVRRGYRFRQRQDLRP